PSQTRARASPRGASRPGPRKVPGRGGRGRACRRGTSSRDSCLRRAREVRAARPGTRGGPPVKPTMRLLFVAERLHRIDGGGAAGGNRGGGDGGACDEQG